MQRTYKNDLQIKFTKQNIKIFVTITIMKIDFYGNKFWFELKICADII